MGYTNFWAAVNSEAPKCPLVTKGLGGTLSDGTLSNCTGSSDLQWRKWLKSVHAREYTYINKKLICNLSNGLQVIINSDFESIILEVLRPKADVSKVNL